MSALKQISLIRSETEHFINGVPGRLIVAGEAGLPTWIAQKWRSEARPIKGYGSGAMMRVEIRFDDECKNRHNTFAITAEVRRPGARDIEAGGCMHDDIAKRFPELAPLVLWHLVSTDGPRHYVANTVFHAGNRDHHHARSSACWPEATDEELSVEPAELRAVLEARLPGLMARFCAAMDGAGLAWAPPAGEA